MLVYKMRALKDGTILTGHMASVEPFVNSILSSNTKNPQALPLRQKEPLPNNILNRVERIENELYFSRRKKEFVKNELLLAKVITPGIYFFFNKNIGLEHCYYVGIADSLKRRLGEHITRRDYIFYSLAFPMQSKIYLGEVLQFYGQKNSYKSYIGEYKRQTQCLECAPFDSIAWITSEELSFCAWDLIETHFIVKNQPCVNVDKKYATPDKSYLSRYTEVKDFFNEEFL